ncbi:MAG: hypothetical protein WAT16_13855 [Saprospiraceae bacterium]|nr:hypothetical protein [Saprospiraceae bacterium]
MNEQDHLKTLSEIKQLMERSSRFLSLSGLSSICIGIYALVGAAVGYWYLQDQSLDLNSYFKQFASASEESTHSITVFLTIDALLVLLLSILSTYLFTQRLAKKQGMQHWDATAKRLLINLLIPFLTGALFCLILIVHQQIEWILSSMLIFYGLALLNASHYTRAEIRHLGLMEILLGLIAAQVPAYGLLCWAIGFGVLHIAYGIRFYYNYER